MITLEVSGGVYINVSNEENTLINKIRGNSQPISKLNEREQELSRKLVSKGLLDINNTNDELCLELNEVEEVYRF